MEIERIEDDYFVRINHHMSKSHYISFFAYVTMNHVQLVKLYPEQNAEERLHISGQGSLYAYCNKHGLFMRRFVR
ncbi:MAG: desulfoferrodoxin family protein [Eubacteriales bacterium]